MAIRLGSVAGRALLQVLAPQRCALCDEPAAEALCAACFDELPRAPARCRQCAASMPHAGVCGACLADPAPFATAIAGFDYAFPLDAVLAKFKYRGDLSLLPAVSLLAQETASHLSHARGLLVPMALHVKRQRQRGFNQAQLLAQVLAAHTELSLVTGVLVKCRDTSPQSQLSADEREDNVRDAFVARGDLGGTRIWLVDDVMTTGATARAATAAMLRAGASFVHVVTLMRSVS